ncbi:MAG: DUF928 domain-containing protein [Leptolyngbya sp. Prado105]|jgi:hypothetical protein|nr:DUF928 domain-containing protein [Leptolyngbya sp. Prado105]
MRSKYGILFLIPIWLFSLSAIEGANLASAEVVKMTRSKRRFTPPKPPRTLSTPGQRSSIGSRQPENRAKAAQITALVPEFEKVVDFLPIPQVWVLSATPHPTFWLYLQQTRGINLEFQLEQSGKPIYQQSVALPPSGLVSISLPKSFVGLQPNTLYRWSLRPADPISPEIRKRLEPLSGWVQLAPISPDLRTQLNASSPTQQIDLYAQNGIWLDSLSILATLYQRDPNAHQASWNDLLGEIGLEDLTHSPL